MSKVKVPSRLISGETSLPGLRIAALLLCPHMDFLLCTHIPAVSSPFYKNTGPIGLGSYP